MTAVVNWGASSVDFIARTWVENAHYWDTKFAMQKELKKAMDANGIEIPFPQRVVHMVKDDDVA
jgi:small conductance mechanosensitive channel